MALDSIPVGADAVGVGTPQSPLKNVAGDLQGGNFYQQMVAGMVPHIFDYIALTYVASGNGTGEVSTMVFKTGGAAGTTVATLTYAYNSDGEIESVTKT
jgi:hypothetical protein